MRAMQGAQIIVLATPVFLLLIAIEFGVGWARGRNTYRLNDALNSIGLGIMSQITGVFAKAMTVGIYAVVYEHFAWLSLSEKSIAVWIGALGSAGSTAGSARRATTACTKR